MGRCAAGSHLDRPPTGALYRSGGATGVSMRRALFLAAALLAAAAEAGDGRNGAHGRRTVLRVCSDRWPPYGRAAADERQGYVVEIARAIFEPEWRVEYVVAPWSRCVADAREGRVGALAAAGPQEAPGLVYPVETVGAGDPTFFTLPSSRWTYTGTSSLAGVRLGAIQGYAYAPEFDAWLSRGPGQESAWLATGDAPLGRLIAMLESGRLDAIVENPFVVAGTLVASGRAADALRKAGSLQHRNPLWLPFSARHPDAQRLAARFDEGLRALRADGRLAAILARYGLADWGVRAEPPAPPAAARKK